MKHAGTQELTTNRLTLRPFTANDTQAMYDNWASDSRVTRFLRWTPHTDPGVTRVILTEWIAKYENPSFYHWAIVPLAGKGDPIGAISVVSQDENTKKAHIGYCLSASYWHQGIMSEALAAVIDFLFTHTGFNRIESQHDPNNPHSGMVMEKCGLQYEGTQRSADYSNQGICDAACYGILREDWVCLKARDSYVKRPVIFHDFTELPALSDGEISLTCIRKSPADSQKGWVPCYRFEICLHDESIGYADLRIGYDENLFYSGNIGYAIDEPFRGHGYAGRACRLLLPAAKAHGMKTLCITNNPLNHASYRVCEKLGARFIGKAPLPKWHSMYSETRRYSNIFLWDI